MRKILAISIGLAVAGSAYAAEPIKLRVAGNLLATGLIQQKKEEPFFESLAKTTGLPLEVDYKPMDVIGIKDAEGLRVLKSGLFDIVTLRIAQVSRDEPFLLGRCLHLTRRADVARRRGASAADDGREIDAGGPAQDEEEHQPADAQPAGAHRHSSRTAAHVLDDVVQRRVAEFREGLGAPAAPLAKIQLAGDLTQDKPAFDRFKVYWSTRLDTEPLPQVFGNGDLSSLTDFHTF